MTTSTLEKPRLFQGKTVFGFFKKGESSGTFWDFVGYAKDNPAFIELKSRDNTETVSFKRRVEIFRGDNDTLTFVGNSEAEVIKKWNALQKNTPAINYESLPETCINKAKRIKYLVEYVEGELEKREKEFYAVKENKKQKKKFPRTENLLEILNNLHAKLPNPLEKLFSSPKATPSKTQYYEKYLKPYQIAKGSLKALAEMHMKPSGEIIPRLGNAIIHLVDLFIALFFRKGDATRKNDVFVNLGDFLTFTKNRWFKNHPSEIDANLIKDLLAQKISIEDLVRDSEKPLDIEVVKLPSASWFNGRLRWFERDPDKESKVLESSVGKDFWERSFLVFDSFVSVAQVCLQYVFADHYRIDLYVTDKETRRKRKTLWLTLLIDCYSRAIIGYYISESFPCIESIQGALRNAIYPKAIPEQLKRKKGDWTCQGMPRKLFLDNAWAHLSQSFITLCSIISQEGLYPSIDIDWRPPYKARYGCIIESIFGNFAEKFRNYLRSAIQKDPEKMRSFNEKNICLLEEDVDYIVLEMILDYMHAPHSALEGRTPQAVWDECMEIMPTTEFDIPNLTPEVERQFWRMHYKSLQFSSKGICIFGLKYWAKELAKEARLDKNGRKILFDIRYNPKNINRIAVFRHGTGTWICDARPSALKIGEDEYLDRGLAKQLAINKLTRERKQSYFAEASTRRELRELEASRLKEKQEIENQQRLEEAKKRKQSSQNSTNTDTDQTYLKEMQAAFERGEHVH